MASNATVEFVGQAALEVPDHLKPQFKAEIETVVRKFLANDEPSAISVQRCFSSFTVDFLRRVVFGVEVRTDKRYQTHILKIGERTAVERDAVCWQACTARGVASRIFAPVFPIELPDESRFAVVYQDGYTLFGPNREKDQPQNLEVIASRAIRSDDPTVASVDRAIAHIYDDLGRWFYSDAAASFPLDAWSFYRSHLKCDSQLSSSSSGKPQNSVLQRWKADPQRQALRRDVVWVVAGRDKPETPPQDLRYLDPVEYIEWVLAEPNGSRLPETLVGRGHGDLHPRNLLLGTRRGEAEYPVAYDYGEMGTKNAIAWDFVKLECELARRLLPPLLADEAIREQLVADSKLRPRLAQGLTALTPREREATLQRRKSADRIRAAVAFHELLHELTTQIHSEADAQQLNAPVSSTGSPSVDRLLTLLLRIRREAAYWLGFQCGRAPRWRDDLYFGIAVHGLLNVRWHYDPPEQEVALVGAGVAIARMQSTPQTLEQCIDMAGPYPSYWVPLAMTHRMWSAKRHVDAHQFLIREVLDHAATSQLPIRADFYHAIPLINEALLIKMEVGETANVEEPLDKELRPLAREFGDFETLARVGRLFKDAGDKKWEQSQLPYDQFKDSSGWQMYRKSRKVYEEAYSATGDYYVGINAATLAFLTGERDKAQELADRVAKQCADQHDHVKDERYWLFATEGEAALIGGRPTEALNYYRNALDELTAGQGGMVASSYKQLCRIAKAMGDGDPRVEPILALFESEEFRNLLPSGYLGRQPAAPRSAGK